MSTDTTVDFQVDRYEIGDGAANRGTTVKAIASDGTLLPVIEVDDGGGVVLRGYSGTIPADTAHHLFVGWAEHIEARMDAL